MSLWFGGNRASVLRALRACEKPHKAVAHFAIYEKSEERRERDRGCFLLSVCETRNSKLAVHDVSM